MTSPIHLVLFLLIVFSIIETMAKQISSHDNNLDKLRINNKAINKSVNNIDHITTPLWNRTDNYGIENRSKINLNENVAEVRTNYTDYTKRYDDIYTVHKEVVLKNYSDKNHSIFHQLNTERKNKRQIYKTKRRIKREDDMHDIDRCKHFQFTEGSHLISHPYPNSTYRNYFNNADCTAVIAGKEGHVIQLTFVDMFHIEYHHECSYDYLEIRDGMRGYAKLLAKVCGETIPKRITTTGPYAWLKFHADSTIEHEGFHINIEFIPAPSISYKIPETCFTNLTGMNGTIDSSKINESCTSASAGHDLDVVWRIETPEDYKIYLNFTSYGLKNPNECEDNIVQVFGYKPEEDYMLKYYCGSVANPLETKGDEGSKSKQVTEKNKEDEEPENIMHVRLRTSSAGRNSSFIAVFNAFRIMGSSTEEKCRDSEFDCGDNTCIWIGLRCDDIAHCRLKSDEDRELCKNEKESIFSETHILVILVIFSLIISAMSIVFLFKCVKKLYDDHKMVQEYISQSCEDRLDKLVSSRFKDAERLRGDSGSDASFERENNSNERTKQKRKISKGKASSIDSDFIQETHFDLDDETWQRDDDEAPVLFENGIRNARTKMSDLSTIDESLRSGPKESEERRDIKESTVEAAITHESGCQTRESLFQEPPLSSEGSCTTDSRGFSTFGCSGATIVKPSSSPPETSTSQVTVELLKQHPSRQDSKPSKKISNRRPVSNETTRSAPDVIIVAKPI